MTTNLANRISVFESATAQVEAAKQAAEAARNELVESACDLHNVLETLPEAGRPTVHVLSASASMVLLVFPFRPDLGILVQSEGVVPDRMWSDDEAALYMDLKAIGNRIEFRASVKFGTAREVCAEVYREVDEICRNHGVSHVLLYTYPGVVVTTENVTWLNPSEGDERWLEFRRAEMDGDFRTRLSSSGLSFQDWSRYIS